MPTLSETLERFNRKERNLLVRDILGRKDEVRPPLSKDFCEKLCQSLSNDDEVLSDAWWATDYHINWLAGALAVFVKGEPMVSKPLPNPAKENRKLVEGNQEDVDLLIVNGQDMIMIEAKAYSDFTLEQIESKLVRLNLLNEFYGTLDPAPEQKIRFFLALQGPKNPAELLAKVGWPGWITNKKDRAWIELQLNQPMTILEVTRCDQAGRSNEHGPMWKTFVSSHNAKPSPSAINPPLPAS